ncbi:hypothetical protein PsorP6_004972 [Peronosclerospora sorghi]|uniref:Uncharacterized protein n=1 Tax=Peronosclerospora sorghi TaxID=230839 RepID=A0ACC0W3D5_9STRA|nr:hypothetical protein PsorP6_004972 [Peronosclerospora sorghi]
MTRVKSDRQASAGDGEEAVASAIERETKKLMTKKRAVDCLISKLSERIPTSQFASSQTSTIHRSRLKIPMWIINSTHLLALFVLLAVEPSASTPIGRNGNDQVAAQRRLHPTLVNAPSLKLQFKLKRRSMNIYNQCEFTVLATPVVSSDNTSVLYDSIATFVENATTTHTFTLVDGMEFFSTSTGGQPGTAECFSPSPLPPFNEIVQALNHATAISSAAVGSQAITCSSGSLLQITLSDDPFVVCASGLAGFDIYGSDLDIQVRYQDKRTPITSNADGLICDQVVSATPVTPTTLALLTGQPIPESTHQKSGNAAKLPSSSCLCKSKRRPCIFFHGFGSKKEDTTLQTRSDYFGDLSHRKYGVIIIERFVHAHEHDVANGREARGVHHLLQDLATRQVGTHAQCPRGTERTLHLTPDLGAHTERRAAVMTQDHGFDVMVIL